MNRSASPLARVASGDSSNCAHGRLALAAPVSSLALAALVSLLGAAGCTSSSPDSNSAPDAATPSDGAPDAANPSNGPMTPWDGPDAAAPDGATSSDGAAPSDGGAVADPRGPGWHNVVVGGGGFISGIVPHPTAPGLIYLRTDMGGAYRYDPAGPGWTPLNDAIGKANADAMGVLSLALDPADADRVYMMTGKYTQSWAGPGAILISSDRGASWSSVALTVKVGGNEDGRGAGERLQVDPNLGSVLLMGTTHDGLWQSTDSAKTWSKLSAFTPSNIDFVLFDPSSKGEGGRSARIFVGVADAMQSLWMSSDSGATWTAVANQPTGLMGLRAVQSGSNLYVAYANNVGPNGATAGAVWRLDTETLAWSKLLESSGNYGFSGISIDAQDPKHLLVSTLDRWNPRDEVFQTRDGGATWSPTLQTATFDRSYAPYTASSTPHWLADVKLDPADPDRMMFVTGYGLWDCRGLSAAAVTCAFADRGIEQTVAMQIVAPPAGAPLLSAMGDIDGFRHEQLDVSPAAGRYMPLRGTTLGLASAEFVMTLVKAHNSAPFGSYSRDAGVTWVGFKTAPPGTKAGGTRSIAVSSDGQRIVWTPDGLGTFYSTDLGDTWQVSGGEMPAGLRPVADRKNPLKFCAFDAQKGDVYISQDGGASFTRGASGLGALPSYLTDDGSLAPVPNREDDDWLTVGAHGLFHSTDGGQTFAPVAGVSAAYRVAFGRAAQGGSYPAIYLYGQVGSETGVFRSDDQGSSWTEVTDAAHKFGWVHDIAGDPRQYGRVFVATEGRGIQFFQP